MGVLVASRNMHVRTHECAEDLLKLRGVQEVVAIIVGYLAGAAHANDLPLAKQKQIHVATGEM